MQMSGELVDSSDKDRLELQMFCLLRKRFGITFNPFQDQNLYELHLTHSRHSEGRQRPTE